MAIGELGKSALTLYRVNVKGKVRIDTSMNPP